MMLSAVARGATPRPVDLNDPFAVYRRLFIQAVVLKAGASLLEPFEPTPEELEFEAFEAEVEREPLCDCEARKVLAEAAESVETGRGRKLSWSPESIVEVMAQVKLFKGSHAKLNGTGAVWDEATLKASEAVGVIPNYGTILRNFKSMRRLQDAVDAYIEQNA